MSTQINGVYGNYGYNNVQTQQIDPKEKEVAEKLGMSYEDFAKLSETEKQAKVQAYNETHPNDPIEDKQVQPQQNAQGSEMEKFRNDIDWKKLKLQ
jgi:DNA-directed RNA polymerase specialized sigma subunit